MQLIFTKLKHSASINKICDKNQGFTLVEVMVAAGVVAIIAIIILQTAKMQSNTNIEAQADTDVTSAVNEIIKIFNTPSHCNANFKNSVGQTFSPLDGTVQSYASTKGIYRCTAATGCSGGADGTNSFLQYPIVTTSWDAGTTKISNRVRIIGITYSGFGVTGTGNILSAIQVKVTFEKKVSPTTTKTVAKSFTGGVVLNSPSTILGCPKNTNSAVPY